MDHQTTEDPKDATTLEGWVVALIASTDKTSRYIQALEKQLRSRTRALWGAIAASAIVVLVLGWVALDNRAGVEGLQQKMCPMVTSIIPRPGDPQPAPGPAGDRGRLVISRFAALAKDFGCTDPSLPGSPSAPTSTPGPSPTLTPPPLLPATPATRSTNP